MSGSLTDKAIEALGEKQWLLKPLNEATAGLVELPKAVKSIAVLFDRRVNISSCGDPVELGKALAKNGGLILLSFFASKGMSQSTGQGPGL